MEADYSLVPLAATLVYGHPSQLFALEQNSPQISRDARSGNAEGPDCGTPPGTRAAALDGRGTDNDDNAQIGGPLRLECNVFSPGAEMQFVGLVNVLVVGCMVFPFFLPEYSRQVGIVGRYSSRTKRWLADAGTARPTWIYLAWSTCFHFTLLPTNRLHRNK